MMHEAARHATHSFETLSVSVETVEAMQQRFLYLAGKSKQPSRGGPEASHRLRMHIDTQARMLRNLLLRSQSNKERLQNEMLRCKSVLQALIVTSIDYCRLARLRACIYCRLLAR
jgi:hypothetical protein